MAEKLVIMLLTIGPDRPNLCGTPFFQAATAAAMDVEVEIYFASSAVKLLKRGVADQIYPSDNRAKTVYEFMCDAAELGAKFYACGGALAANGVRETEMIPECTGMAGAAAYINRVMDDEWRSITY